MAEPDPRRLHVLLLEIGRALALAGTAVSETEERLLRIAAANGAADARIVVLPTALLIAVGQARETTIEAIPQRTGALRLDQIAALYRVVRRAEVGELDLEEGLRELRVIRAMKPRYGAVVTVLAYTAMTAALCLILQPTPTDVLIAAGFGLVVGTLIQLTRNNHALSVLTPVLCALIVSAFTFQLVQKGIADPGLRTLIAPLVTFLPGGVLTTATVELASGEMVAGASRLVFGFLQLMLLSIGIIAGVELAGLPRADALENLRIVALGPWAPWAGVVIFTIAVNFYFSAPRGSLPFLVIVVLTAWAGQMIGEQLFGSGASGFFGALVMTPVALAVSQLPGGPPSQVTFLPAFWLLVPGAIGLVGITELVGNPASASMADLMQTIAAVVSIALGVLCGVTVYRGVAAVPHRLRRQRRR
ncbi:MAG TPA: threonine/serine exporter family protein [Actinophytocola sp.]|uniref:threonine/serine ThrE exporter family protein n=1 Tax=Actinophytocola sp. TaxID=1872138 RepID=UPI002DBBE2E0|nr:threonine/serine exporter family protein [Actinophytocola sp.]HEU5471664.1 threonine/serine exporter family protein [Actinophytocola sp.]